MFMKAGLGKLKCVDVETAAAVDDNKNCQDNGHDKVASELFVEYCRNVSTASTNADEMEAALNESSVALQESLAAIAPKTREPSNKTLQKTNVAPIMKKREHSLDYVLLNSDTKMSKAAIALKTRMLSNESLKKKRDRPPKYIHLDSITEKSRAAIAPKTRDASNETFQKTNAVPVKKKRGRPIKYVSLNSSSSNNPFIVVNKDSFFPSSKKSNAALSKSPSKGRKPFKYVSKNLKTKESLSVTSVSKCGISAADPRKKKKPSTSGQENIWTQVTGNNYATLNQTSIQRNISTQAGNFATLMQPLIQGNILSQVDNDKYATVSPTSIQENILTQVDNYGTNPTNILTQVDNHATNLNLTSIQGKDIELHYF